MPRVRRARIGAYVLPLGVPSEILARRPDAIIADRALVCARSKHDLAFSGLCPALDGVWFRPHRLRANSGFRTSGRNWRRRARACALLPVPPCRNGRCRGLALPVRQ